MPYIGTRTNKTISKEKELIIKEKFGEAITILDKSESWLMLEFTGDLNMYFQGNGEDGIAYIDIKLLGSASSDAYNKMTQVVTEIISNELEINPSKIYVSYSEFANWGWNGNNF